ncbi:Coq4 family protein [Sphingomonas donggukensis]|uniref:Coq4 family protein n=1 Tax=Sphingomonas donggukensis TaxID=2949093 RepID=A0ABY4TZD9_9SPHN|nr:Coq4 family protein [Sphingomonas donggukensis]URW75688.1 Coq4 family protein [Sphingomonas donggukensis]
MATQAMDMVRVADAAPKVAPYNPGEPLKRDWRTAWSALRRLMANGDDTVQVFRIMRALNADASQRGFRKLITTREGGRLAYERVELAERFSDRAWLDALPEGTVGAAYRSFLDRTGFSAKGLADISMNDYDPDAIVHDHPYTWFGRRERDMHDIWHTLTGYTAEEHLGELCLVAFSYAQTGGLGWAAIGGMGALKSLKMTRGTDVLKAVLEGYRHGKRAKWLSAEDYVALLAEPLDQARRRLNIAEPVLYRKAQAMLAAKGVQAI